MWGMKRGRSCSIRNSNSHATDVWHAHTQRYTLTHMGLYSVIFVVHLSVCLDVGLFVRLHIFFFFFFACLVRPWLYFLDVKLRSCLHFTLCTTVCVCVCVYYIPLFVPPATAPILRRQLRKKTACGWPSGSRSICALLWQLTLVCLIFVLAAWLESHACPTSTQFDKI